MRSEGSRNYKMPDLGKVPGMSAQEMQDAGFLPWGAEEGHGFLWLFRGAWYPYIPEGIQVVSIAGEAFAFKRGVADNDTRYGVLSFGLIGPALPATPVE